MKDGHLRRVTAPQSVAPAGCLSSLQRKGNRSVTLLQRNPSTPQQHIHPAFPPPPLSIMHLPRILSTFRFACASTTFEKSSSPLARISFSKPPVLTHIRHATHKATRASNGAKDGPGKRLGAKKTTGTALNRTPPPRSAPLLTRTQARRCASE